MFDKVGNQRNTTGARNLARYFPYSKWIKKLLE